MLIFELKGGLLICLDDEQITDVSSNQVQLPRWSSEESSNEKQETSAEKKDEIPKVRDSYPLRLRIYPPH